MATAVGTFNAQQLTIRDTPARQSPVLDMLRRDHFAQAALVAIVVIVMLAVLAPVLPIPSPTEPSFGERLKPPLTPGPPLGHRSLGRDVLPRIIWGARVSLVIGALAAA